MVRSYSLLFCFGVFNFFFLLEFVDDNLMREGENENVFPVSILKIKERDGRQEFLLCYHGTVS